MYVKEGAVQKIRTKRQGEFLTKYIEPLVKEANKLSISKKNLLELIERGYDNGGN